MPAINKTGLNRIYAENSLILIVPRLSVLLRDQLIVDSKMIALTARFLFQSLITIVFNDDITKVD